MDITTDNFSDEYDQIVEKIKNCDFCSIDCELSGITNFKNLNSFDTPKTRYDKMRKNDQNYLILQFGLCLFKSTGDAEDPKKAHNSYECTAYNCYLFPRSQNHKYSHDSTFSFLNSSVEFLISQNFDFNKQFTKGITFMSKDAEEKARAKYERVMEEKAMPKGTIYPSNKQEVCEQIDTLMREIEEFYLNDEEKTKEINFTEFLLRIYIEKNLKLKYQKELRWDYKFLENKERLMTLRKVESKEQKSDLEMLDNEIGFSKIIWYLSQSEKLIVGHNMLTDTMQILRQFFSQLPENFEDFKSMTNALFPNVIDTKYMASLAPLKELITNTTLGDMDKILSKEPFPQVKLDMRDYELNDDSKLHEAGYDAFLTGYCYIRMLNHLASFNSSRKNLITYYSNKIHLMRSFDISFIDFKNKQDEPKRDNVFYLKFPSTWTTQNLYDLFGAFGSIYIGWIDDSSAFVALQNADNTKKAAAQLVGVTGRDYKVYFYSTYQNQLNKVNNHNQNNINNNNNSNNDAMRVRNKNGTNGNNNNDSFYSNEKRKNPSVLEDKSSAEVKALAAVITPKKIKLNTEDKKSTTEVLEKEKQKEAKPFEENADWSTN